MRGTHHCEEYVSDNLGITPAYAGNTNLWRETQNEAEDHPRLCGEHVILNTNLN